MPRTYKLAAKTRSIAPKAKPAPSQARLKKAVAKNKKRRITPYPAPGKTIKQGLARSTTPYPNAKAPLVKQGSLPGAGAATRGVRKKAPALTPQQKKLIAAAMPKAKAQRSAAQIAAMQAYRAAGGGQKRRAKGPSFPAVHTKGGHYKPPKSAETTRPKKRKPPGKKMGRQGGIPHTAYPR